MPAFKIIKYIYLGQLEERYLKKKKISSMLLILNGWRYLTSRII